MAAWNFDPTYMSTLMNLYGFTACPKCREPYRFAVNKNPKIVICDDCGFEEPRIDKNDAESSVK